MKENTIVTITSFFLCPEKEFQYTVPWHSGQAVKHELEGCVANLIDRGELKRTRAVCLR